MNEKPHQIMENQNDRAQKGIVLRAEVAPSLKCGFIAKFRSAGFASEADAIRTLARDFVTGRLQYIGGMLKSQEKNCPEIYQTDHRDNQQGVSHTPESAEEKNQGERIGVGKI